MLLFRATLTAELSWFPLSDALGCVGMVPLTVSTAFSKADSPASRQQFPLRLEPFEKYRV